MPAAHGPDAVGNPANPDTPGDVVEAHGSLDARADRLCAGPLARRACSLRRRSGVRFEAFLPDLTGRALRGVRPPFCEAQWTT